MNFYPHRIPCLFTFVPLLIHSSGLTIDNSFVQWAWLGTRSNLLITDYGYSTFRQTSRQREAGRRIRVLTPWTPTGRGFNLTNTKAKP